MAHPLVLVTERESLSLRQLAPVDAAPLFALIDESRPHLSKWGDITEAKYPDFASVLQSITHPHNPDRLRLGIWGRNILVGSINLTSLPAPYHAEVGYWLGQQYTGCGYMTCALKSLVRYAFDKEELWRLTANVREENLASQKVLERAGFRQTSAAYCFINYALQANECVI